MRSDGRHAVNHRDQRQRENGAEAGRFRRRGEAAVERDHHARQEDDERQHARQRTELFGHRVSVRLEDGRVLAGRIERAFRRCMFLPVAHHGVGREQRDQQKPGKYAGKEQPAERLFGGDRIEDHGDRRRQQDAERAAGGDHAAGEAAGIAAPPHFRNAGRADRRTGRRRGTGHRRKDGAGQHVGDAKAAGHAMHPRMQGQVQVLSGARFSDGGALEDEQRDGQERDRRHFLVNVLRHRIERRRGHEEQHEHERDAAEGESDRHAREHRDERRTGIEKSDGERAHARRAPVRATAICSAIWTDSSVMPAAISA